MLYAARPYPAGQSIFPVQIYEVSLYVKWFDAWVGLFFDRKKKVLYIQPMPMFGLKVQF